MGVLLGEPPIGTGDPEGGYPYPLGKRVKDESGGIFVGSDVSAVVTALRTAGILPKPEPYVSKVKDDSAQFEVMRDDGTPVRGDEVDAYLREVSQAGGVAVFKFAGFPDSGVKPGQEIDPSKIL